MNTIQMMATYRADDGTYFIYGYIYEFTEVTTRNYTGPCPRITEAIPHYTVIRNGTTYYIPDKFAAYSGKPVPAQNKTPERSFQDQVTTDAYERDGTFDMVGATKDFFGLDIAAKPFGDQADYETPGRLLEVLSADNPTKAGVSPVRPGAIGAGDGPAPETDQEPNENEGA